MKKVKSKEEYSAYLIKDENDLDEFILNEIKDHDSVHIRNNCCKVSLGGVCLFKFCFGEWLVVFSDRNIKNYSDEDFLLSFLIL